MKNKELKKKELKEHISQTMSDIRLVKTFYDAAEPGLGNLLIDVMVEELEGMRSETYTMNFGMAIEAAKQGKKIARKGWNGKNQYVELASCISYKNSAGEVVNAEHCNIGNKALAFVGTSGVQIGWLASQADMLADDWYIVE